jgi:hypothetical protein
MSDAKNIAPVLMFGGCGVYRPGSREERPDVVDRRRRMRSNGGPMTEYRAVTREELDNLAGEALPERAAMSLINANVAIPVNAAVAANVLTDHSVAGAHSAPNAPITQQPDLRS